MEQRTAEKTGLKSRIKNGKRKKEKNIAHKTARKVIGAIILMFCVILALSLVACVVGVKTTVFVALAAAAYATLVDIGTRLLY